MSKNKSQSSGDDATTILYTFGSIDRDEIDLIQTYRHLSPAGRSFVEDVKVVLRSCEDYKMSKT